MARWTQKEYEEYLRKQRKQNERFEGNRNRVTLSPANMEPVIRNESLSAQQIEPIYTPCCIHIHSIRRRLADPDGVSGKAAIDGIVHSGILADDSAKEVKEVSYSQEQGEEEKTIITITY